ncbi:MAG: nitroreductase/quinone reductase family protein [Gammaproteobacteria bacterium]
MSSHVETSTKRTVERMSVRTIKIITKIHKFLRGLTGNRFMNTLGGDEVCFVKMSGAKSGRSLNVPLMHIPHGENVLLVASQGGNDKNPVWYHNLVKHPEVSIEHRGNHKSLVARLASREEKNALWPVCDAAYAPFADYRKFTDRDIPIFVCEPK